MGHDHSHDHNHAKHLGKEASKAFVIGIALNLLFVLVEVIVGFAIHSLSLLSDAGHNLADVAGLGLSLLALRLATVKPSDKYTYGYSKTSVLVALINGALLLISIGAIIYEAIQRLIHPEPLPGMTISIVAAVGIIVNGGTAFLFMKGQERDLNVRSAYLHMAADALVSFALVIGGILIYFTHLYWIDALLSIIVAVVIIGSTWRLLRDSLRLTLDGVPANVDIDKIRSIIMQVEGVIEVHHIHIWAISTTMNAMTGHLVVEPTLTAEAEQTIKKQIRHQLHHLNIQHATLETEVAAYCCDVETCADMQL